MGPLTWEAYKTPLLAQGLPRTCSLSPVPRKTCSRWFESGCGVSCRESPEARWAHARTQARARISGSNSPGASGVDGGDNESRVFKGTVFIH